MLCVHFLDLTLNRHGLNEVHCFFCIEQKCCDQNKTFFFHSHGCCKAVGIRSPWPLTSSAKLFIDWMGSSNLVHTSLKTFRCVVTHSRVIENLWGPLCLNLLASLSQTWGTLYRDIIQYFIGRKHFRLLPAFKSRHFQELQLFVYEHTYLVHHSKPSSSLYKLCLRAKSSKLALRKVLQLQNTMFACRKKSYGRSLNIDFAHCQSIL